MKNRLETSFDLLLQNILNYDVVSTTNTLASRRSGMYSSKLYLLDIFNKDYKEYDYDYLQDFDRDIHVDQFNRYGSEKLAVSEMIDDYNNTISEYPDSVVYLQTIDRDIPDGLLNPSHTEPHDYMGTDRWLQRRKSRFASLNSAVSLRLQVPNNTFLQKSGDLIGIILKDRLNGENDETLTGKYLVSKLHHKFKKGGGLFKHEIYMDCVRDTVQTKYPNQGVKCVDGGSSMNELLPTGDPDLNEVMF